MRSKIASSPRLNGSGSTRLATTAATATEVSLPSRSTSSTVSVTGISSGVVTTATAVVAASSSRSRIHAVWSRDHADVHEIVDHPRGGDLGDDVAGRLGVDDDEVVVALAHLEAQLADGEDLLHAGRRVGDEVERAGERPDAPDQGDAHEQPQVLAERVLGVHRHGEQARLELARGELQRGRVVGRGERTLGVHLADEHALALRRAEARQRGRDRGLADPALAGDEHQPAVEQRRRQGDSLSCRSRRAGRRRACRSRRRRSSPSAGQPAGHACR